MVDAVTSIATSGIRAADTRVTAAATNVANAQTPNFKPVQVAQTQAPGGGTETVLQKVPLSPAELQAQQTQDQINASIAVYDAQASVLVLRVQKNLNQRLFDIQA